MPLRKYCLSVFDTNMFEIITKNPEETKKIGEFFSEEINKKKLLKNGALILCLNGDLGGGKTTFVQGLAKGFKIKQRIKSPTFLIVKKYSLKNKRLKNLYHLDCYRIQKPQELIDLGFEEIIGDENNLVVVEWAEKIKKILSFENVIFFKFEFLDFNKRKIIVDF